MPNQILYLNITANKNLKSSGQKKGDFRVPLYKSEKSEEKWFSLEATTFKLGQLSIKETKFDTKTLINEKTIRSTIT